MTLYDYLSTHNEDYDVYDNEFDNCVTVCPILDSEVNKSDSYDVFCNSIIKHVKFISEGGHDSTLIADWSGLIRANLDKFRAFSEAHWWSRCEDDDEEFVYQWINEISAYMAGYVSEDVYSDLVELVNELN